MKNLKIIACLGLITLLLSGCIENLGSLTGNQPTLSIAFDPTSSIDCQNGSLVTGDSCVIDVTYNLNGTTVQQLSTSTSLPSNLIMNNLNNCQQTMINNSSGTCNTTGNDGNAIFLIYQGGSIDVPFSLVLTTSNGSVTSNTLTLISGK